MKWLASLVTGDVWASTGLLIILGGAVVFTAYTGGRRDGVASCNSAALKAENAQLRDDLKKAREIASNANARASADAAEISMLNEQVEGLTHAFDAADNACRLSADDARKLRGIR